MSNKKRTLTLASSIVGIHFAAIFILWLFLDTDQELEPEFEKVISVRITNTPQTSPLPPINQQQRDKIEEEKRKKEEERIQKKKAEEARKRKIEQDRKKAELRRICLL